MDELRFDGKVAIVTGGGRGLGRTYALLLASRGANVVVNDPGVTTSGAAADEQPAADVVAEITAAGGTAAADTHSVLDGAAAIVDTAITTFGRLDVLVNNAGISGGGAFASIAAEDFDRVFDTHIRGTVAVTRAAWPHLAASGSGRIVNISSASVFGGGGTSAYISAKAAIFGLTRALAPEAAHVGMRVNSVMPSAFTRMTNQIPDDTFRTFLADNFPPEAVAPFVVWLAHASTDVNGETFSVGGGRAGRVFLGETPGAAPAERTPEAWAANAEQVLAVDGFRIPPSMMDEVLFEVANLRESTGGAISSMDASDWSATARR